MYFWSCQKHFRVSNSIFGFANHWGIGILYPSIGAVSGCHREPVSKHGIVSLPGNDVALMCNMTLCRPMHLSTHIAHNM